jgi:hypothetical protein
MVGSGDFFRSENGGVVDGQKESKDEHEALQAFRRMIDAEPHVGERLIAFAVHRRMC